MQNITTKTPGECSDISDVRNEIDNIDKFIISLISQRFEYVKEVVKYKKKDAGSIEAPERRMSMMRDRRHWAEENGLNADVIESIYDSLVDYFIMEEKKIVNL